MLFIILKFINFLIWNHSFSNQLILLSEVLRTATRHNATNLRIKLKFYARIKLTRCTIKLISILLLLLLHTGLRLSPTANLVKLTLVKQITQVCMNNCCRLNVIKYQHILWGRRGWGMLSISWSKITPPRLVARLHKITVTTLVNIS